MHGLGGFREKLKCNVMFSRMRKIPDSAILIKPGFWVWRFIEIADRSNEAVHPAFADYTGSVMRNVVPTFSFESKSTFPFK